MQLCLGRHRPAQRLSGSGQRGKFQGVLKLEFAGREGFCLLVSKATCTLTRTGRVKTGVHVFEVMLEDFPTKNITLTYAGGRTEPRGRRSAPLCRVKLQFSVEGEKSCSNQKKQQDKGRSRSLSLSLCLSPSSGPQLSGWSLAAGVPVGDPSAPRRSSRHRGPELPAQRRRSGARRPVRVAEDGVCWTHSKSSFTPASVSSAPS